MVRELSDEEVRGLHYELLMRDIVTAAEVLPPFPDVAWNVMSLIKNAASLNEIEDVIKNDHAITASVLALSRLPLRRGGCEVHSLHDAILALGSQKLIQVIMTAGAARYFEAGVISGYDVDERDLWQHSVGVALMGEILARHFKHRKLLTIYTAGLLHDIGKTVLDVYAKIYLNTSLKLLRDNAMVSIEFERKALGMNHQELGEVIVRRWKFPNEVATAIGYHHSPLSAPTDRDVAVFVYVADQIVSMMTRGERIASFVPEEDRIFRKLGMTTSLVQEFQERLLEVMDEIALFMERH